MPAINPRVLVDAILDAVQQSEYAGVLTSSVRVHPRRFVLTAADGTASSLWVYAWTLTFGGRQSLPDEYRIQMTTVASPLPLNPSGQTVLLGYEPTLRLFAGFDLRRHRTFTAGSPSVQVDIHAVRNALQFGLTFDRKSNDEIAVGIRPDQLINYALTSEFLHRYGTQPDTLQLLTQAATLQPMNAESIDALTEPRRRIVATVSRLSRSANFRQQVLRAYDNRCAVTRIQLRLVDAAHIVPVGAPASTDHVTNGIALSPSYHRAYDNGLIFLDENYDMRINPAKMAHLAALQQDGGIDDFRCPLGRILLPQDNAQWPHPQIIRRANVLRLIGS